MLTDQMKKQLGLQLAPNQEQGIQLENGAIRTGHGVVIAPREQQPKRSSKKRTVEEEPAKEEPVKQPRRKFEEVTFDTPVGQISGLYGPVVVQNSYVVLGLSPQSFVPQSYSQNKTLRLTLKWGDTTKANLVFTGCKFKDEETNREYIILMEVQ